jgi:hypothetical protein
MFFEGTPYEVYLTYLMSEQEIARILRQILENLLRCWEMVELTDPNGVSIDGWNGGMDGL